MQQSRYGKSVLLSLAGLLTLLACGGGSPTSLVASPPDVAFGDVVVGTTVSRTVTLSNNSPGPVTILDVTATGSGIAATGAALPLRLGPGDTTALAVRIAPHATGDVAGAVTVRTDATQEAITVVAYEARAVLPSSDLAAAPATIDFGDVVAGASATRSVTLTNGGSKAMTLSGVTSSNAAVTAGLAAPVTLAAGATRTVDLTFRPAAAGATSGYLALYADQNRPLALVLYRGNGVAPAPALSPTPAQLDFPDVVVGDSSTQTVTLANDSAQGVTISELTATGEGLSVSGLALPVDVAPGASVAVGVRFTPAAVGPVNGSVSAIAAGQAKPLAVIPADGTGAPAPAVTGVTVRNASVEASRTVQLVADVAATGTVDTAVTWSVEAGSLGTVDPVTGVYTAPATAGTHRVIATSNADPTKSGVGTVTVTAPAPVVAVSLSPATASVTTGGTRAFAATVTGTANTAVTWSVQEGAAGGTVSASGLYTAPATAGTYHVVARSAADATKSATATVTVTAPAPVVAISVSPTTASVTAGGTRTFAATVTGTTNTGVTWSVQEGAAGGAVTAAGVYTAPAAAGTYHVVARSQADATKSATATVTVTAPSSVAISLSPTTATVATGGTKQFIGTVTGTTNTAVWYGVVEGAAGGSISTTGLYTAPATPGTYHVRTRSKADSTKTAEATVTVTAPAPPAPAPVPPPPAGVVPAFPGAEGGGALSKGGRGGKVIKVTNLNDSGTGSLRACVQATGPRTCVFSVSGTINLTSALEINRPYITIAGQTSPGGIQLKGKGLHIRTHDVVVRYLRVRGAASAAYNGTDRVVIDHCSFYYTPDENFSMWSWEAADAGGLLPVKNLTFSWSIMAYPLASHPTQMVISGKRYSDKKPTEASVGLMTDIDLHHNFVTDGSHRAPGGMGRRARWINNIVFNHGHYWSRIGGKNDGDFIGNVYRCGVISASGCTQWPITIYTCADTGSCSDGLAGTPSVFASNNAWLDQANAVKSAATVDDTTAWANLVRPVNDSSSGSLEITGSSATKYRRSAPLAPAAAGLPVRPLVLTSNGSNLAATLLDYTGAGTAARAAAGVDAGPVGASRRLDCSGRWVDQVDGLDKRVMSEYLGLGDATYAPRAGGRAPAAATDICWASGQCGFPTYPTNAVCSDVDADGMPDAYETSQCGSATACDPSQVVAGGFTRLEHYLNGSTP